MLRNFALATFLKLLWRSSSARRDAELAGIAGKAVKEARYHQEHAADWVVRLGDGTDESAARMQAALDALWPYVAEMFESDAVDDAGRGRGPRPALGRPARRLARRGRRRARRGAAWRCRPSAPFRSTGKAGRHSEHLGYILAEMQHLQRAFPGGVW